MATRKQGKVTRMVVLYGGQQLQQLPPPEDPVPFRIAP